MRLGLHLHVDVSVCLSCVVFFDAFSTLCIRKTLYMYYTKVVALASMYTGKKINQIENSRLYRTDWI